VARIVGILCTYNEERNIRSSLGSLTSWCDEVWVVDQHSTDRTREIAAEMGAQVHLFERVGLPEPARDWARTQVDADWVLFLDADEIVPATLGAYLRRVLTTDLAFDVLYVPRVNIELGRWLKRSGNWPSRKARVSRPDALDIGTRIHRAMKPRPGSRIGLLPADPALALWHFHHPDVETMVGKWNKYTTIEAQQTAPGRKRPPGIRRLLRNPASWFWRSYLLDQGWRDGRAGLVVAVTRAYYRFLVVAKLWDTFDATAREERLERVRERLLAGHTDEAAAQARAAAFTPPVAGSEPR
jgi:glycosyltransferase involved in cell wall biosynthesis